MELQYKSCTKAMMSICACKCVWIWENRRSTHNSTFVINSNIKTIGKICKYSKKKKLPLVSELALWSTNLKYHCVCLLIKSYKILVFYLCTGIIFWVTTVCLRCSDKGIYGQSFLADYTFLIKYTSTYMWIINVPTTSILALEYCH